MNDYQPNRTSSSQERGFEDLYLTPTKVSTLLNQNSSDNNHKGQNITKQNKQNYVPSLWEEIQAKQENNQSSNANDQDFYENKESPTFQRMKQEEIEKQRREKLAKIRFDRVPTGKSTTLSSASQSLTNIDRQESPISVDRERDREEKLKAIGMRNTKHVQENHFGALPSHVASNQSKEFQPVKNIPTELRASDDSPTRFYLMSQEPERDTRKTPKGQGPRLNDQRVRSKTPTNPKRNLVIDSSNTHSRSRHETQTTPKGVSSRGNLNSNHRSKTPKGTRTNSSSVQQTEGSMIQEKFFNRQYERDNINVLLQDKVHEDIKAMANSKKMLESSYALIVNKLEKTVAHALLEVDKENRKKISFEQLGRLFTLLGVFRVIQYNENLELENEEQFFSNDSADQVRKNSEMLIHEQIWMLLTNKRDVEHVDAEFTYIVVRLLLDPASLSIGELAKMLEDYIQQYREALEEDELVNGELPKAKEDHQHNTDDEEMQLWPAKELVRQFRKLNENRLAYTKIGYFTHEKELQDSNDKELTFTPKINTKSRTIEADLTQKFIKQHLNVRKPKKETKTASSDRIDMLIDQIKNLEREHRGEYTTTKYNPTENDKKRAEKQSVANKTPDRVEIIYKRHELFKNWLKEQRKLREKQLLEGCTFQPNKKPGQRPLSPEDKEKTFDKLHAQTKEIRKKKEQMLLQYQSEREAKLKEECPFKPKIKPLPQYIVDLLLPLRNRDKSSEPIKTTHIESNKRKDRLGKTPVRETQELKNQASKAISFSKNHDDGKTKNPFVYLDIDLPSGKKGRLGISEDDNPIELARNFINAHQLEASAFHTLKQLISDQINEHVSKKR